LQHFCSEVFTDVHAQVELLSLFLGQWEKLPEGWSFVEIPGGVAVDSREQVYALTGGQHRVIWRPNGLYLKSLRKLRKVS
jgi:hypothetical protein